MSQSDVFDVLKNQRETGNVDYFTIKEIQTLLKNEGKTNGSIHDHAIRRDIRNLYNFLDISAKGNLTEWNQCFRIKKRYCQKKSGTNKEK